MKKRVSILLPVILATLLLLGIASVTNAQQTLQNIGRSVTKALNGKTNLHKDTAPTIAANAATLNNSDTPQVEASAVPTPVTEPTTTVTPVKEEVKTKTAQTSTTSAVQKKETITAKTKTNNNASNTNTKSNSSNTTRTTVAASRGVSSKGFIWPVPRRITSYYGLRNGRMHKGLDIAAYTGQKVSAAKAGTVYYSGWVNGYGETVMISHTDGMMTLYGHNSKRLVNTGDQVTQGQTIALAGSTGRSTGPHVHFEIQKDGQALNPLPYLP